MSQFKECFSVDNWEDDCLSGGVDTPQYTCRCLWIPPSFVRMCLSVQLSFQPLSVWILITRMCLTCVSLPPGVFKPTSPLLLSQIVLRLCGKHLVCPSCLVCWKFELLTDLDFSAVLDWYAASETSGLHVKHALLLFLVGVLSFMMIWEWNITLGEEFLLNISSVSLLESVCRDLPSQHRRNQCFSVLIPLD